MSVPIRHPRDEAKVCVVTNFETDVYIVSTTARYQVHTAGVFMEYYVTLSNKKYRPKLSGKIGNWVQERQLAIDNQMRNCRIRNSRDRRLPIVANEVFPEGRTQ